MSNITLTSTGRTITIQQTGQPGRGVPAGGTTGQVLAKASGTDYETAWVTGGGGGGSSTFVGLTDTPSAFVADRIVTVNSAGNALEFPTASDARTLLGLGSAAVAATGDFATDAQGTLAETAVQPGDLATVATSGSYSDLSGLPSLFDGAYSSLSNIPSTFAPSSHNLNSHSDVIITLPTTGDSLFFNGSDFVNRPIAASDVGSGTFSDALVAESNVTQHEAALSIIGSQITADFVRSTVDGISDSTAITNMVSISLANYNLLSTYDATTLYVII